MQILSLLLLGKGQFCDLLCSELIDLGHSVAQHFTSQDLMQDYDIILSCDTNIPVDGAQKRILRPVNIDGYHHLILCHAHQAHDIESMPESDDIDEQTNLWVDAIIALSKQSLTDFDQIELDISQFEVDCVSKEAGSTVLPKNTTPVQTIDQWFSAQAALSPMADAVAFLDQKQTYQDLDQRSNQLARYLQKQYHQLTGREITPDTLIPICLRRDLNLMVAILAVLKAGAAYVPINPDYPAARVTFIIEDTDASLMITQREFETQLGSQSDHSLKQRVCIDEIDFISEDKHVVESVHSAQNLAYVIYTSGTTGKPKGVMVEHKSVINLIESQIDSLQLTQDSRALLFSRVAFDASVGIIFPTLCSGGCLYVLPQDYMKDAQQLSLFLKKYGISVLSAIPSVLQEIDPAQLPAVKTVEMGAEVAAQSMIDKWLASGVRLINAYGPTECTVCATHYTIKTSSENTCIGQPIQNVRAYVLNDEMQQVEPGQTGELYIAGQGIARGYLNQPELTAARFIDNPFSSQADKPQYGRLYKTNDMVCCLTDGKLAFKGRNDFQVKLGGHRIELSSIDHHLLTHPAIMSATTLYYDQDQNARLIGFIVCQQVDELPEQQEIKRYLSTELPDYMVPAQIIRVDALPLTSNGKVDRVALCDLVSAREQADIKLPQTDLEKKIHVAWLETFKIDHIGVDQDFYELGGNSLRATALLMKLNTVCIEIGASELTLAFVFNHTTIEEQAVVILASLENQQNTVSYQLTHHPDRQSYPLSRQQARYYFLNNYDLQGKLSFIVPLCFSIKGNLSVTALSQAIDALVARHDIFRYAFKQQMQDIVQMVQPCLKDNLVVKTLPADQIKTDIESSAVTPFDLSAGYLCRFTLYQIEGCSNYVFSIIHHHIIADGWSLAMVFKELTVLYAHYAHGEVIDLQQAPINYGDYCLWESEALENDFFADKKIFWREYLARYEPLSLHAVHSGRQKQGASYICQFDDVTHQALSTIGEQHSLTLLHILHASLCYLLHRYTDQSAITIGTLTANRFHQASEYVAGPFINIIPLLLEVDENVAISDYLKQAQKSCLEALANQELPFDDIVEIVNPDRDDADQTLVNVWLVIQEKLKEVSAFSLAELDVAEYAVQQDDAQADLVFNVYDQADNFTLVLKYAAHKFSEQFISALVLHWQNIIVAFAQAGSRCLREVNIFDQKTYQKLLGLSNSQYAHYPVRDNLVQIFEQQVQRFPDHIAVVDSVGQITYQQLNSRANQLAHYFRKTYQIEYQRVLKPDTLIALYVDRGIDMITAILGVLKSGAAYVPLSPKAPNARNAYVISDAKPELIICHSHYHNQVIDYNAGLSASCCISVDTAPYHCEPVDNLPALSKPTDLAYVIYTSGTTGQPKGVLQLHQNVVRLFKGSEQYFSFNDQDVWSLFHSYVFDFSVWELWGALLYGGKLWIPTHDQVKDTRAFYKSCQSQGLTILNQTPAAFYNFIEAANQQSALGDVLTSLRSVIFGGEALETRKLAPWFEYMASHQLTIDMINMYGITETTVHVTYKKLTSEVLDHSIGKPLPDLKAYILDNYFRPVPVGAIGELYVGGAGLARGYLNRPDLTAERFIDNPFATPEDLSRHCRRLYKTGDLVRWLPNGELEYIGRNDAQVKIRGYRIELGEIEAALLSLDGVKQGCVLVKERAVQSGVDKYLVGYYVADQGALSAEMLTDALSEKLPNYMVPSAFIGLADLPLTINGKLDRKALPEPEFMSQQDYYLPPRNPQEEAVCVVWQQVLGVEKVGIQDDFFRVGGNSILAIQVASSISERLGMDASVADIFSLRTVSKLCQQFIEQDAEALFTGEL